MARFIVGLLCLALAVGVLGALVNLLLIVAAVFMGGLVAVLLFEFRRNAFWALMAVGALFLVTKIGPWGLAFLGIWLVLEARSALTRAKTAKKPTCSSGRARERLLAHGSGGRP
jgi:hypothetical protein